MVFVLSFFLPQGSLFFIMCMDNQKEIVLSPIEISHTDVQLARNIKEESYYGQDG